jgi:hypothetical protein
LTELQRAARVSAGGTLPHCDKNGATDRRKIYFCKEIYVYKHLYKFRSTAAGLRPSAGHVPISPNIIVITTAIMATPIAGPLCQ